MTISCGRKAKSDRPPHCTDMPLRGCPLSPRDARALVSITVTPLRAGGYARQAVHRG